MSLVFDLAELINIGVGGVIGEGTGSFKDYLVDSVTRSKVSNAFRGVISDSVLEPTTKDKLLDLVDEKEIVNLIVTPSGTTLTATQASWNQILKNCDPAAAQKLRDDLAEVGTSVILSQQSLPDQILHSRIAALQRTISETTQTAADQALREELATHIEKLSTVIKRLTNESIGRVSAKDSVYEYRKEVLEALARVDFSGREEELAQIESFARAAGNEQWWWWTAGPWAGKTTLMAQIAKNAFPSVRVAYLFIIGRQVVHADSDAFYSHLLPQLALLAGLDYYEKPTDLAGKRTQFNRLLKIASYRAQMANETILLIVDGLDEDQGTPPEKQSVAYSLPAEVPINVRILVASRGNPPLPDEVPPGHPLRTIPQHLLTESPAAVAAKDRAIAELRGILRISDGQEKYGRDILAFLAASEDSLTTQDLSELTGQSRWTIDDLLASRDGRSFNVTTLPNGRCAYTLGHDMLDQLLVTEFLDTPVKPPSDNQGTTEQEANADRARYQAERHAALRPWRHRIADWGQKWAAKDWPDNTPEYLASGAFVSLLFTDPDLQDLGVQIVTHDNRTDLLARKHWADDEALSQLQKASQGWLDNWTNGHLNLLQLAKTLTYSDSLAQKYTNVPEGLPVTLARLGQWRRAIGIARAIPDPSRRALALIKLTPTLNRVAGQSTSIRTTEEALKATSNINNSSDKDEALASIAQQLATADLTRALEITSNITDDWRKAKVLTSIAQQLATTDPTKASEITEQALKATTNINNNYAKAEALASIAQQLATADLTRALEITSNITDDWRKAKVLTSIAQQLATTDPTKASEITEQALEITNNISDDYEKAEALTSIAQQLATTDPARSSKVAEEALTIANTITNNYNKAQALANIAEQLTTTTHPEIAHQAANTALTATNDITVDYLKAQTLANIATYLATTDPARSSKVAEEALTIANTITNNYNKAQALASIAQQLATTHPETAHQAANTALTATNDITDLRKVESLADIAQQLAITHPETAHHAAQAALAIANNITDSQEKAKTLAGVARYLTTTQLKTTSVAASSITNNPRKAAARVNTVKQLTTIDLLLLSDELSDLWLKLEFLADIGSLVSYSDTTAIRGIASRVLDSVNMIIDNVLTREMLDRIDRICAQPTESSKVFDFIIQLAKVSSRDEDMLRCIAAELGGLYKSSYLTDTQTRDMFSQQLGKIWLAAGHPWYGWTSLPYLVPDQVQDFIDLANGEPRIATEQPRLAMQQHRNPTEPFSPDI